MDTTSDAAQAAVFTPQHKEFVENNGYLLIKNALPADVVAEIDGFVAAHSECGTGPGGVHVELTGDAVTECLGGSDQIRDTDLEQAFETLCDPRLNGRQSLDLAFRVAELLTDRAW